MQKNGSNNLDSLYFSISVFCSRPVPYCSVYSIYRHAHISIIGRNAALYSFFGAYFYGKKNADVLHSACSSCQRHCSKPEKPCELTSFSANHHCWRGKRCLRWKFQQVHTNFSALETWIMGLDSFCLAHLFVLVQASAFGPFLKKRWSPWSRC